MKKAIAIVTTILVFAGVSFGLIWSFKDNRNKNKPEKKKPLVLTFYNADGDRKYWDGFNSDVAREITKYTHVKLKTIFPIEGGDEKLGLMLASGNIPDLMFAKGYANKYINAGQFINLAPYIDKYGQNIKKLYGKYLNRLRYSLKDKSIYQLGAFGVDDENIAPGGFGLQHAVVKELGYPKIKTLKDYENVIRRYLEKHPTIDGKPTIGLSLLADTTGTYVSLQNQAAYATGLSDDGQWYIDPQTHKATYHILRAAEKEYYKWLNHMFNNGLMDKEAFVQKKDQYISKIAGGRVLAITDSPWEVGESQNALRSNHKEERMLGWYPVSLNNKYKNAIFQDHGYTPAYGVAITKKCKHVLEAFKFLNWMASEKAQILTHWGIRGKNYELVNGKRKLIMKDYNKKFKNNLEWTKRTGVGLYSYPFPEYGSNRKDSGGDSIAPPVREQAIRNYTSVEKNVLKHYGVEVWKDLYPSEKEFPVCDWGKAWGIYFTGGSNYDVILTRCDSVISQSLPDIVMSDPSLFNSKWQQMIDNLYGLGLKKAEIEFTKLVRDRVKLWNSK